MKNAYIKIAILLAVVITGTFPLFVPNYWLHLIVVVMINAIAVVGLGILGASGQISNAQGAFYGIGAYTSSLLMVRSGMSFWTSLLFVILFACVVGFMVGLPTIKVSGLYLIMTTLGVNEIIYIIMMNFIPLTNGPQGVSRIPPAQLFGISFRNTQSFFYLALAFLLLHALISTRIYNSRLGLYFIAMKNSDIASKMNGVNVVWMKLLAFIVSAVFGGISGALYANYTSYIHPDNFKTEVSVLFLTMSIFGGQRSVVGMIAATAVLTIATEYFRNIGEYRLIAYGLLLIVGMIYMPGGIGGRQRHPKTAMQPSSLK